jgi:hypothetical protein
MIGHNSSTRLSSSKSNPRTRGLDVTAHALKCDRDSVMLSGPLKLPISNMSAGVWQGFQSSELDKNQSTVRNELHQRWSIMTRTLALNIPTLERRRWVGTKQPAHAMRVSATGKDARYAQHPGREIGSWGSWYGIVLCSLATVPR